MRILKRILVVIGILLAIPLILALFTRKDYLVEREVVINKPRQEVFDYIRYLKNQDHYSKWAMMDPTMQKSYRGTDGQVGFVSAWDSKNEDVGAGEQEIKQITDGEKIDLELRFLKPFESTQQAYMSTEALSASQTKVKWGFKGHMNYPTNVMLLFVSFDKFIGDDLNTGLLNLKKLLEQ